MRNVLRVSLSLIQQEQLEQIAESDSNLIEISICHAVGLKFIDSGCQPPVSSTRFHLTSEKTCLSHAFH